jgi:hypothetical protein
MGTRILSLEIKQQGCEADNLPTSNTEFKKGRATPPLFCAQLIKHRENLIFFYLIPSENETEGG